MSDQLKRNNSEAVLPTLPVLPAALSGSAALMLAYRLLDAFQASGEASDLGILLAFVTLFLLFLGLQGVAAGFFTAALEKKPSSFVPHLTAPVVFLASLGLGWLILGRSALPEALFTVVFYLSGFFLFRARSKVQGKKTCILYAVVPAVGLIAVVFLLRVIIKYGSTGAPFQSFFTALEEAAGKVGQAFSKQLCSLAGNQAEALLRSTLTDEALSGKTVAEGYALLGEIYGASFAVMLRVLPALAVAAMSVYGYVAASVCNTASIFRRDRRGWHLTVSGVGSLIFFISMIATILFVSMGSDSVFGVLLYSMRIIFLPAFIGLGAATIAEMRGQFSKHLLLTVIGAILIVLSPFIALPLLGLSGNVMRILNEKRKQMNDGDGQDNPKL